MKRSAVLGIMILGISCGFNRGNDPFHVMTFNIRYDNPADGLNDWSHRKNRVIASLLFFDADIIGLQEVLHHQLNDIKNGLPGFEHVGVARDDGNTSGEYAPVLYHRLRFNALSSGTFWLAPQMMIPGGPAWDAACPRIATWAVLHDLRTGHKLLCINTHFDHIGHRARLESARLIRCFADSTARKMPVVLTGDLNCTRTDSAWAVLTVSGGFKNVHDRSTRPRYGSTGTFNGFNKEFHSADQIDFILIRGFSGVGDHGVVADRWNGEFVSDHHAVLAEILY